jgi:hypothetical protein
VKTLLCNLVLRPSGAVRHKTGRAKSDFELREISKEECEKLKSLVFQENFLLAS